jgi:cytochrome c biogenesis protein CcmG/thiol:disulfide interchange protein DsbE
MIIAAVGYGYYFQTDYNQAQDKDKAQKKVENQKKYPKAPDFSLKDLEGNIVKLSDYEGKVVIIDFWATWCGPCRRGIPDFVELQEEFGEEKLQILGVNLDRGDLSVVPDFAEEYKMNYPVLYADRDVQMKYGPIRSIPTMFIVDKQGYVRDMQVGLLPKSYFVKTIESLL